MSARANRYDYLGPRIVVCKADELPPPDAVAAHETPEGYLRVRGRINGCGVYQYEDEDGEQWGELRLPKHVGAQGTVDSWKLKAITDDHPPVWLDAANTHEYQRGVAGTDIVFNPDDEYTWADLLITGLEVINKIRTGKTQLSCGYSMLPVFESGIYNGDAFRLIQTGIFGNHISVVDLARGGPGCSLVFDCKLIKRLFKLPPRSTDMATPPKKDAVLITESGQQIPIPPDKEAAVMAALGVGADAPPPNAAPPQPLIPPVDADPAVEEEKKAADSARKAAADRAQAHRDMQAAAEQQKQQADAKQRDAAKFNEQVDNRVALVTTAHEIAPTFDAKGKTDNQIKVAIIKQLNPAAPSMDGKSDDYITSAYDYAMAQHSTSKHGDILELAGRAGTQDASAGSLDAIANKQYDAMKTNVTKPKPSHLQA